MKCSRCRFVPSGLLLLLLIGFSPAVAILTAADSPRDGFVKNWKGSRVLVKQVLYTLVYSERSLVGNMSEGKRAGLNVVTPFDGAYFQFDGRRPKDHIIDRDPRRVQDAIATKYVKSAVLDMGTYPTIEALSLERYDTGFELVVSAVKIERDTVRLLFRDPAGESKTESATTLTVKWPMPFSKSFTEHPVVENLIQRFVEVRPAKP